ncbi:DNA-directed RNA polymerase subunit P [Thalassoglobus neptunius]|uniref:DNA-directed RNA polymerase subunit P n=1 Tax=Thalassoglobus neptunius TaxID=1938619 RepID=A0A5C5X5Y0_9PLAN|nr:hypothetical protein [Thalassoglobus neptunius]TWT57412.1 DNA-directed RNA polymerase subunit P [Thalassoglobus neptunius]
MRSPKQEVFKADHTTMSEPPPLPGQQINDGKGRIFPCEQCGADLKFHIGEQSLKCPFCGAKRELSFSENAEIREQNFEEMVAELKRRKSEQEHEDPEHQEVRCESCGTDVIFDGTLTSIDCPYCGSPLQREKIHTGGFRVNVDAVMPFQIDPRQAQGKIAAWVQSLWFAPNDFKKIGAKGKCNGVYLPFWTFDTLTFTVYHGERGEDYTTTVGTGDKKRTVTRTRWYTATGKFQRFFDDVLINATGKFSKTDLEELGPWPLDSLLPFTQEVIAGHFARTYDVELEDALPIAKQIIDAAIRSECRGRIGGDRQRVHSVKTRYDAVTYKHCLLPIYMLAYRYKGKSFRVFVNGASGTVRGERPFSWVKISAAVLSALAVVITGLALFSR